MRIFIANNPEALKASNPTHTVEAEFGDVVVNGSVLTLAHHGSRANNPCPCTVKIPVNQQCEHDSVIGISHFDLDALGGIMACQGIGNVVSNEISQSIDAAFWYAAAYTDLHGPHRLQEAIDGIENAMFHSEEEPVRFLLVSIKECLNAFWAWSEKKQTFPAKGRLCP